MSMSNHGRCKDCKWGEPVSGSWKWHCTYYKTLEDPDEIQDCNHFDDDQLLFLSIIINKLKLKNEAN